MLRYFTIAIAALALCHSAKAQSATGAIQGRVTDRSGGAVPEASVKIENKIPTNPESAGTGGRNG